VYFFRIITNILDVALWHHLKCFGCRILTVVWIYFFGIISKVWMYYFGISSNVLGVFLWHYLKGLDVILWHYSWLKAHYAQEMLYFLFFKSFLYLLYFHSFQTSSHWPII
jgi:hypothetical protein